MNTESRFSSRKKITLSLFTLVTILTSVFYVLSPSTSLAGLRENTDDVQYSQPTTSTTSRAGKTVVIHLDQMLVELKDGAAVIDSFPIITQGRPGSYYETIGGEYHMDYKEPTHFSSIGHVYMPSSVHVFGNYFIHGIPYHTDGTQVSSAYSGGCVRLSDENALKVFNFVERGTPIILTRNGIDAFQSTQEGDAFRVEKDVTRYMAALVSLDALTQDSPIVGPDGEETTRRTILRNLIVNKDDRVIHTYAEYLGETTYTGLMNQKARALGLTNTHFENPYDPVHTTNDDYLRMMQYVDTYKPYIRSLEEGVQKEAQAPIN